MLSGHSPTTALLVAWLVVLLMGLVCAYLVHGEFCDPSYLRAFLKKHKEQITCPLPDVQPTLFYHCALPGVHKQIRQDVEHAMSLEIKIGTR